MPGSAVPISMIYEEMFGPLFSKHCGVTPAFVIRSYSFALTGSCSNVRKNPDLQFYDGIGLIYC